MPAAGRSSRALRLASPVVEAGAGHAFAEAAFFDEVFFQAADELVEEVVGLVDEANGDVGQCLGRARFHIGAISLIGFIRLRTQFSGIKGFLGVFFPLGPVAHAEKILVVEKKLLKAGAGDVHELDLGFGRGDGGLAALGDVLFSRARGLEHLVASAVALGKELFAEAIGVVVDYLGLAVGMKSTVVSGLLEECFRGLRHGE